LKLSSSTPPQANLDSVPRAKRAEEFPIPGASIIHVCRHGEVFNPEGRLYTRLPGFHLSENGQAMARRLGEYFAPVPVQLLRSSPLERAQETIAPIAANYPTLNVETDDRLIEADSLMQGQVFGKYNRALLNPKNWWLFRNPWRPSWGEPYVEIAARMLSSILDAAQSVGPNARAVLVSHQSPIWVARLAAEGRPLPHLPNGRICTLASVTTFVIRDGIVERTAYAEPARDLLRGKSSVGISQGK
jgi:broad specificity phosphatase PhoE